MGHNAELLHHTQDIHLHPSFNRLAVHDALDSDSRHRHLLASWRNTLSEASMYPLVSAPSRPTRHDQISFGNLVLNRSMEVGKGGAGRNDELLVEIVAGWLIGNLRVVTDIAGGQELFRCGQVPLVPSLFNNTPGKSLILLC